MLVESPFMGDHMYAQRERYIKNQQVLELKGMMKNLKQFPVEHFKHGVPVGRRSMPGFNTALSSISSQPVLNTNSCLVSPAPACRSTEQTKAVFPKFTEEVSAFGPKHAEHARRFYQSKGLQLQDFRQVAYPIHQPNYCPKQVSNYMQTPIVKRCYFLRKQMFDNGVKQAGFYVESIKSHVRAAFTPPSNETILKVAKISPRPSKKQLIKTKTLFDKNTIEKCLVEKSVVDFQASEHGIDLSNAPVFQILGEISNTT